MQMTHDERREALESLVTHPGWRLWIGHVTDEWGPHGETYNAQLDKALNLLDDSAAASQARQVRAGRKVIESLIAWPGEELARLKRSDRPSDGTLSRRGGL